MSVTRLFFACVALKEDDTAGSIDDDSIQDDITVLGCQLMALEGVVSDLGPA